jgi:hypothetical protein
MAFRIHDLTIHLMPDQGAGCLVSQGCQCPRSLSGTVGKRPEKSRCDDSPSERTKGGDGGKKGGKGGKRKPGGGKKKSLELLRAQLRDTLAPPPM